MNASRESLPSSPNRVLPWLTVAAFLLMGAALYRQSHRTDALEAALNQQAEALAQAGAAADHLTDALEAIRSFDTSPAANPAWSPGARGIEARVAALEMQLQRIHGLASLHPGSGEVPEYDPDMPPADEEEPEADSDHLEAWSAEQVVGPPNTPTAGDARTAWAPREQDGGAEWLQVGFANAAEIAEVRVRESFNAGAIVRITAQVGGAEVTVWEGAAASSKRLRDFVVRPGAGLVSDAITIHLDTARAAGWNEIDAVALIGRDGSRQWASSVRASSSYGSRLSGGLERLGTYQKLDWGSEPRP